MTSLTSNQLSAKALIIGQALWREAWWDMNAEEADAWCRAKAKEDESVSDGDAEWIAFYAMGYVIYRSQETPEC